MRIAFALAAAALAFVGGPAEARGRQQLVVKRASLRTRMASVAYLDELGPPRIPVADVEIRGLLPGGFDLDGSGPPVSVEVLLNGVAVLGGEDDSISVAPSRRRGRWDPAPSTDPAWGVEYAPWLRVRLDLVRRTFHFRTRGVDHAVMEGNPLAVPYVIRIGDREFSGTIDFQVAGLGPWSGPWRAPRDSMASPAER